MYAPDHFLFLCDAIALKRARRWLLLGVAAFGMGGFFAGLLGGPANPYFGTALVEHVDLSVLIWFLSMACMLFTLAGQAKGWGALSDAAFCSFACGTVLVIASALTGATPYKSDYIPVIHHPLFFMGLGLVFCGVLGVTLNLLASGGRQQAASVQHYGIISAAWIMIISAACFVRSQQGLPAGLQGQVYYEYVFWGGGHVLQFVHTQLVLVAWAWLASAAGLKVGLKIWQMAALYFIGLLATVTAAVIYAAYTPASDEFRESFTLLMKHMNGLAPLILAAYILVAWLSSLRGGRASEAIQPVSTASGLAGLPCSRCSLAMTTLLMSMLLFIVGGGFGYLIKGSNVIVPAHYHGSIIGITLALMGVCYLLLPAFGYRDVTRSRLALAQPVIYGGGQLCWMVSMVILGEYGVPRKTAGSADTKGMLISFLKHSADGLALIGGLLFVFIVLRAVWKRDDSIIR